VTFAHVGIHAADRIQAIEIHARIISASVAGLPIVEHQHAALADDAPMPTLLCFSGGGCSGAMFALLAEKCLAQGVQGGCVRYAGPYAERPSRRRYSARSLVSRANGRVRRAATDAMVSRWAGKTPHLDVLSHSAGIVDVSRIAPQHVANIGRFLVCGAGMPGPVAMLTAVVFGCLTACESILVARVDSA
jgi:hypothetical protein